MLGRSEPRSRITSSTPLRIFLVSPPADLWRWCRHYPAVLDDPSTSGLRHMPRRPLEPRDRAPSAGGHFPSDRGDRLHFPDKLSLVRYHHSGRSLADVRRFSCNRRMFSSYHAPCSARLPAASSRSNSPRRLGWRRRGQPCRHHLPRRVISAASSTSAAVGASTWSAVVRAAPRSCSKPAIGIRPGFGARISTSQGCHGRWSSRAWPLTPAFAPTTDQER
jgi:hypothetical protein